MTDLITKYTYYQHNPTDDEPDRHLVYFKVGVQSFQIAEAEDEEHAKWYQRMFSTALENFIKDNAPNPSPQG